MSPGRSFSKNNVHTHDVVPYLKGTGEEHHDFGHIIHTFSFGAEDEFTKNPSKVMGKTLKQRLDIKDPLENLKADTTHSEYMFQYFTKVVATEYRKLNGEKLSTFQYSATSYERDLGPRAVAPPGKSGQSDTGTHSPHQVQHGFMGVPGVFFVSVAAASQAGQGPRCSESHAADLTSPHPPRTELRDLPAPHRAHRVPRPLLALPLLPLLHRRRRPHPRRAPRRCHLELEDKEERGRLFGRRRWRYERVWVVWYGR